jgi:hypothetical protein
VGKIDKVAGKMLTLISERETSAGRWWLTPEFKFQYHQKVNK